MKHWKGQKQAKDINEIFFEKKKSSNLPSKLSLSTSTSPSSNAPSKIRRYGISIYTEDVLMKMKKSELKDLILLYQGQLYKTELGLHECDCPVDDCDEVDCIIIDIDDDNDVENNIDVFDYDLNEGEHHFS